MMIKRIDPMDAGGHTTMPWVLHKVTPRRTVSKYFKLKKQAVAEGEKWIMSMIKKNKTANWYVKKRTEWKK